MQVNRKYHGLKRKPNYEEFIDYLGNNQEIVKYPNRKAIQITNTPYFNFVNEFYDEDRMEYICNDIKDRIDAMIDGKSYRAVKAERQTQTDNDVKHKATQIPSTDPSDFIDVVDSEDEDQQQRRRQQRTNLLKTARQGLDNIRRASEVGLNIGSAVGSVGAGVVGAGVGLARGGYQVYNWMNPNDPSSPSASPATSPEVKGLRRSASLPHPPFLKIKKEESSSASSSSSSTPSSVKSELKKVKKEDKK
jgi:hypothetical protein